MLILWDGDHILKAYFDSETSTLDLVSSFLAEGGRAAAMDGALSLGVDEDGLFHHLSLTIDPKISMDGFPERPNECPVASKAEVELFEGGTVEVAYDAQLGLLCMSFAEVEAKEWARLGPNLVWLALDEEAHLSAIVVEGISKDPGGKAQAAWLAEMGLSD